MPPSKFCLLVAAVALPFFALGFWGAIRLADRSAATDNGNPESETVEPRPSSVPEAPLSRRMQVEPLLREGSPARWQSALAAGQITLDDLVTAWLDLDREGFFTWLKSAEEPLVAESLKLATAADPGGFLDFAKRKSPLPDGWDVAIVVAIQRLADTEPQEARRWLESENGFLGTLEWVAYSHAIRSQYHPLEVFAWTQTSMAAEMGFREDLYQELATRYHRESPEEAIAWVESLEEGHAKSNLAAGIVSAIAVEDADRAADWAESLPEGKAKGHALFIAIWKLSEANPPRSFALADEHGSSHGRLPQLTGAVRGWAKRDPEAAREAVATVSGLSELERTRLETWIYAR